MNVILVKKIKLLIPICATVFYACGNVNDQICDDKSGDEAGEKGELVINLWCEEDISAAVKYIEENNLTAADIDDEDVALFHEKFITNPSKRWPIKFQASIDKFMNLFRNRLSPEEALIAEANISGMWVVSLTDGSTRRVSSSEINSLPVELQIIRLVIPYGVTSLGDLILDNSPIEYLIIPSSVKSLKRLQISNCTKLTSLII